MALFLFAGVASAQQTEQLRIPFRTENNMILVDVTVNGDRIFGKPKQEIGVSGGLLHAHTRDPRLAAMPKDALEALAKAYDEVLSKYPLDAAQDAPQNQIESKPAIAAEVVESEDSRQPADKATR